MHVTTASASALAVASWAGQHAFGGSRGRTTSSVSPANDTKAPMTASAEVTDMQTRCPSRQSNKQITCNHSQNTYRTIGDEASRL